MDAEIKRPIDEDPVLELYATYSLGKDMQNENFQPYEPSQPIYLWPERRQCQHSDVDKEGSNPKNFEVEQSILSKFVWPDQSLSIGFFGILARHGGVYIRNIRDARNIDVEMIINIGEISLLDFLVNIFNGQIPADCSLFLQILLQKDFKNRNVTLALGLSADAGIDVHAHVAGLKIGHYSTKDVTLHSLLQKSTCTAKSQWVIKTGMDQYLGMTKNGPKFHSDLEWRTHIADGINDWIRDVEKCFSDDTLLQRALRGLTIVDIQIHCQDNGITIDANQIRFNANVMESILSHNASIDSRIPEERDPDFQASLEKSRKLSESLPTALYAYIKNYEVDKSDTKTEEVD